MAQKQQYECKVCGAEFPTREQLEEHKKKAHQQQPEQQKR
ncbi:MAG: C2H2-type zinc finger protein [Ardenticatenaceae bacterium]|nr:C2H2-type zinc finger protein [Ardenticatenaceae bacterium]HBY94409.1 hypothetical protein [Chloroflexota bacterium]